jgi:hypothetical protein
VRAVQPGGAAFDDVPRGYDGLREYLAKLDSKFAPGHLAEGIVFHHPDSRRAKIKRKDFPAQRDRRGLFQDPGLTRGRC